MTRSLCACSLGAVFLLSSVSAQEPAKSSPSLAEVRFADGSVVRMTILQEKIDVQTRFGKLTVPTSEIRRIEFGLHVPDEVRHQINHSIKRLASDLYRERDVATRDLLQAGHWAYPSLQLASRHTDQEVAQRASNVLKQMADRLSPELTKLKDEDVIITHFPIIGRISTETLRAHSTHFGEVNLKLSDLRTCHFRQRAGDAELVVDAAKYGSLSDQWFDTGIHLDASQRLQVQTEGQVDIWPQGPGQYMASPKGFNTPGKGGQFQAGALVGRIGETGRIFLVGERYNATVQDEGNLLLQIVPSPWNNASTGSFRVRIQTDHAAFAQK